MSFLAALDAPLLSTSLILPGQEHAMTDPQQMRDVLEHHVDVIIDGGILGSDPTTLVQVDDAIPTVKRQGIGTLNSYE